MSIACLKRGKPDTDRAEDDARTRAVVEATLADIERRGDAAVRPLSEKFDRYTPDSFRLGLANIEALTAELTQRERSDLRFAQDQVRNFARAQRDSMPDIEVETLPSVILCDSHDEMLAVANDIASEHVQLMTDRDVWYLDNMTSCGALFLGPRTNVADGDRVIGTNHTPPTKKAGRYTGGLWVGNFLKPHSYQKNLTDEAAAMIEEYGSCLCILEGFVGHAEQCNIRVRRYGGKNVPYSAAAE